MATQKVIQIENLNLKIGNKFLLKDINWEICQGENWILFGQNGCGKTTLLSIIAGYSTCLDGNVTLFGEASNETNWLNIRKRIAWISSSFFDKHYTNESVLQIVLSGKDTTLGIGYNINDSDIEKALLLLDQFKLRRYKDRPYCLLSKGERQNVLIARALMNDAQLYILDEPCSGLDVNARDRMIHYIRRLANNKQITLIYVTHYAEEIPNEFDHILLMRNGRIYAKGNAKKLLSSDSLSAFLESPLESFWSNNKLHLNFYPQDKAGEKI